MFGLLNHQSQFRIGLPSHHAGSSNAHIPLQANVKLEGSSPTRILNVHARHHAENVYQSSCSPIVELSSDSGEDNDHVSCPSSSYLMVSEAQTTIGSQKSIKAINCSPASSVHLRPPLYPIDTSYSSIMPSLKKLRGVKGCRNELASIDFDSIEHHKV